MEGHLHRPDALHPNINIPEEELAEVATPAGLSSADDEPTFPPTISARGTSDNDQDHDQSAGLDSYTLAKQQGSKIDILFQSKTEEAWTLAQLTSALVSSHTDVA